MILKGNNLIMPLSFLTKFGKTGHSLQKGAKKFQWDRVVCDYCHKQIAISGFSDK